MTKHKQFAIFDVLAVPLESRNLIEASAGTGKTYSIAVLMLRLLLEKKLHLKEILMVTFTRAAVAELEERIRLFVRTANRYAADESIDDETIQRVVEKSWAQNGREETTALLKEAVLYLDELSVMTIHGFCQLTLHEFAFETRQFFGAEVSNDQAEILTAETQNFWRRHVATMETLLLRELIAGGLSLESIENVVKNHAGGKTFLYFNHNRPYTYDASTQAAWAARLATMNQAVEEEKSRLLGWIAANLQGLTDACLKNRHAKRYSEKLNDPEIFLEFVLKEHEAGKQYIAQCFGDLLAESEAYVKARQEQCELVTTCLRELYCFAIQEIAAAIRRYRSAINQLTYDDLIANLHAALCREENAPLVAGLQRKYKAVFVDEFQDTDRQQYDIFDTAFAQNTTVFYIGDPKQSIYGWRKADIFTYFKAYHAVENRYSMNVNYRSTPELIDALNYFFYPQKGFDTFYFKDSPHNIDYIPVQAPAHGRHEYLFHSNRQESPITLDTNYKKNDALIADVAAQVLQLLTDPKYTIRGKAGERRVQPSDIGILVRKNDRGEDIRRALAEFRIPAVTVVEAKVMESAEARELLFILEAISDPIPSKINRALLTGFTGYSSARIDDLHPEDTVRLFKQYKGLWETRGIYEAVMAFVANFGIRDHLLHPQTKHGERVLTNLYHLVELLYKHATLKNMSAGELTGWLKRNLEKQQIEGDEWEQRIERDEEAVNIITIHKSKGLQFPIVIAPQLDFRIATKGICAFKDDETNEYIAGTKDDLTEAQLATYTRQQEQENRRLLYVALTRAVFKIYIYRNVYFRETTLSTFLKEVKADGVRLEEKAPLTVEAGAVYAAESRPTIASTPATVHFELLEPNWRRMSYTMLAAKTEAIRRTSWTGTGVDAYDQFVFNDLAKGMITGNMLHYIFENIHFDEQTGWTATIEEALRQFAPAKHDLYAPTLPQMLQHVLEANVGNFSLSQITTSRRIHELEFHFPVGIFVQADLQTLEGVFLKPFPALEGMMTGKIDLFFEHGGQYYVLDWKSTYLGSALADYDAAGVEKAMEEQNYHLQYLIYALAVSRYLKNRLDNFDYERDFGGVIYCFVRGMRKGTTNGVFFCKPDWAVVRKLEEMWSLPERNI